MSIFEFSDIVDESNAEFIPLLSAEDEDKFNAEKFPETLKSFNSQPENFTDNPESFQTIFKHTRMCPNRKRG